jgi:hypothetical protein
MTVKKKTAAKPATAKKPSPVKKGPKKKLKTPLFPSMTKGHPFHTPKVIPSLAIGRSKGITRAFIKDFAEIIKRGNFIETAAMALGVRAVTVRDWIRQGTAANETDDKGSTQIIYRELADAYEQAKAIADILDVQVLNQSGDWKASLSKLRVRNKKWRVADEKKVEVSGNKKKPITHEHSHLHGVVEIDPNTLPLQTCIELLKAGKKSQELPEKKNDTVAEPKPETSHEDQQGTG